MIQTLEPILREHPFFQGMEDQHIRLIAGCSKNVRFGEGLVSVQFVIPHDGLTTVLTAGGGEVLGWSWLFPPYRWHFDARAQQATHALAFDGKCLRAKCDEDHDLGYEIYKRFMQVVTERLEATRLQLLDIYGSHV